VTVIYGDIHNRMQQDMKYISTCPRSDAVDHVSGEVVNSLDWKVITEVSVHSLDCDDNKFISQWSLKSYLIYGLLLFMPQ
jgi:hypothetical protein